MTPQTRSELRPLAAMDERTRDFEKAVVKMATNPPSAAFIPDIKTHIDTLLTSYPTAAALTPGAITLDDFLAYCILVNYQRRMKNYDAEEAYIRDCRHIFAAGHPFFDHMTLLSMMDNLRMYTEKEVLELADKNCAQ